ncbi:cell envelope biogenesis protein OmpA [Patiriisocius marinistellae]|uniref:Cell envelope biogenesis protein OmpA n=1 Tax=Patiriisocius marinistellae TaxID=2494560 RepID=A0A5J4FVY7_9FLAO|nr:OmpA family protein [Patiriisocius marinistellae]GEQ86877.1 cell envelope biogenesis protein OmpA [Patiriisocius marinistellae]
MKYCINIIAVIFLLNAGLVNAQKKAIKKGNKEIEGYSYIDAQEQYLKLADEGFKSEDLFKGLGDSYYFTADYINASKWYGELYQFMELNDTPDYLYRYAQSLKSAEQYKLSNKIMIEYRSAAGIPDPKENNEEKMKEIVYNSGRYEIRPVSFNSSLSDFAPAFNGNKLTFASNRIVGSKPDKIHNWNEQPFLDLYSVIMEGAYSGTVPEKIDDKLNTQYHESTAVYTKDLNTIYFTRNNYTKGDYKSDNSGTNRLKLYRGIKNEKEKWDIIELPFNSNEYSVAHPALSVDEKTLYFASDMPGGFGLSDLYKVDITNDGFGTPINLGDNFNTEQRDTFPFISSDNMLYYASEGLTGLGGLDIFVADLNQNTAFDGIVNVGKPINSPKDDFGFIIHGISRKGFFSSNRDGGKGFDDIYGLTELKQLQRICTQSVIGIIRDKNTNQIISGAKVILLSDANEVLAEDISDDNGAFKLGEIDCERTYTARATKNGYSIAEKIFTSTAELALELDLTLNMSPIITGPSVAIGTDLTTLLNLENINFDYDKSFIRPDAAAILQRVVNYMNEYPTVKIDVRSHTDSRGRDSYNQKLSQRRNKATREWLINKGGISSTRLSGQGYGESRLVNECSNGVPCGDEKHERNRRSEFIVVSK